MVTIRHCGPQPGSGECVGMESLGGPPFTFVVPVRGGVGQLRRKVMNCLELLDRSGMRGDVIVVDDGAESGTVARAVASIDSKRVRYLNNTGWPGKLGAILAGLMETQSELCCVTDVDVIADFDIRAVVSEFDEDVELGMLCGCRFYTRGGIVMRDLYTTLRRTLLRFYSWVDSIPSAFGPVMILRLPVDIDWGKRLAADDVFLPMEIRLNGKRCRFSPHVRFDEELPGPLFTEWDVLWRRAGGQYEALFCYASVLGRARYGLFGIVCVPLEWCFFLGGALAAPSLAALLVLAASRSLELVSVFVLTLVMMRRLVLSSCIASGCLIALACGRLRTSPTWTNDGKRGRGPCGARVVAEPSKSGRYE